ncbi:hypothetical protein AOLI_G00116140 [Acnodon oligacanthus]
MGAGSGEVVMPPDTIPLWLRVETERAKAHANARAYARSAAQGNGVLFPQRNGSKLIGIADEAQPCPRRPRRDSSVIRRNNERG